MTNDIIKLRTTESLTTAAATVTDQMPTMKAMLKAVRVMRAKIDEQRARELATLSKIKCEYCGRNIKPLDDGSYLICQHIQERLWKCLKTVPLPLPLGVDGIQFVVLNMENKSVRVSGDVLSTGIERDKDS